MYLCKDEEVLTKAKIIGSTIVGGFSGALLLVGFPSIDAAGRLMPAALDPYFNTFCLTFRHVLYSQREYILLLSSLIFFSALLVIIWCVRRRLIGPPKSLSNLRFPLSHQGVQGIQNAAATRSTFASTNARSDRAGRQIHSLQEALEKKERSYRELQTSLAQIRGREHKAKIELSQRGKELGELEEKVKIAETQQSRAESIIKDLRAKGRQMQTQTLIARQQVQETKERLKKSEQARLETSEQMERLIDSLRHYLSIDRDTSIVTEIDVNGVVAEAVSALRPIVGKRQVQVRIPKPLPCVVGDVRALREIFLILVENAAMYNDKDERWIEIGHCANDEIHRAVGVEKNSQNSPPIFYVRDNGIGVREEEFNSIFKLFNRSTESSNFGVSAGVGLSFAKEMVQSCPIGNGQQGQIWLSSTHGEGSTFYFNFGKNPTADAIVNNPSSMMI